MYTYNRIRKTNDLEELDRLMNLKKKLKQKNITNNYIEKRIEELKDLIFSTKYFEMEA